MTDTIVIRRWDTGAVIYDGPRDGLAGRDLSGADLRGADLSGINLRRATLSCANLSCANLRRADLFEAKLCHANLYHTNLYRANLSGADLSRSNLSFADLSFANLLDAKFCTEDGKPCTLRAVWQAGPIGSRGDMLMVFATDRGMLAQTGCFGPAPVDDFLAAVEKTHGDNQHGRAYRAAIECARAAMEVYAP